MSEKLDLDELARESEDLRSYSAWRIIGKLVAHIRELESENLELSGIAQAADAQRRELESASQPGGGDDWTPVENAMPTGRGKVLATYLNSAGNARRIIARYIEPKTVEAHTDDDESCAEYDEATDTYWLAGGWYECIDNWGDYSQVQVCEGDVSHWMPLPAAPSAGNGGAEGGGK